MREPRLEWEDISHPKNGGTQWRAKVGGVRLAVFRTDYGMMWDAHDGATFLDGVGADLPAAMCDAEEAAIKLLREGVEALGGFVLDSGDVPVVAEALKQRHADIEQAFFRGEWEGNMTRWERLLQLANELQPPPVRKEM